MSIREKVARAMAKEDNNNHQFSYNFLAGAAITAFLEALDDAGLRILPKEATREMVSAGLRVTHAPIPIYRAMVAAAVKYELDGE